MYRPHLPHAAGARTDRLNCTCDKLAVSALDTQDDVRETMSVFEGRPGRLLRPLFRLPVYLYRLELGWLLGHRFLLLTHRGRKTGLLRQTVVEVIHYDPATRESVVLSALGPRADWLRNIQAGPPLEVQTGHDRYVPAFRVLSPEQAHEVWSAFERSHPWEASVAYRLFGWPHDLTDAGRRELARTILLVAFRPRDRML